MGKPYIFHRLIRFETLLLLMSVPAWASSGHGGSCHPDQHYKVCQNQISSVNLSAMKQNDELSNQDSKDMTNPSVVQAEALKNQQSLLAKAIDHCAKELKSCHSECHHKGEKNDPCSKVKEALDQAKQGGADLAGDAKGTDKAREKSGGGAGGMPSLGGIPGGSGGGNKENGDKTQQRSLNNSQALTAKPNDASVDPSRHTNAGSSEFITGENNTGVPLNKVGPELSSLESNPSSTNAAGGLNANSSGGAGSGGSANSPTAQGGGAINPEIEKAARLAPRGLNAFASSSSGGGGAGSGGGHSFGGSGYRNADSAAEESPSGMSRHSASEVNSLRSDPTKASVGSPFSPLFRISSDAYQSYVDKHHIVPRSR